MSKTQPTREDFAEYVSYVVDDAGNGRGLGDDPHAIVREIGDNCRYGSEATDTYHYASKLVGWQCGFEPLFVAVHSYLDVELDDCEAEEMAADYLEEIGWFGASGRRDADYIIE